MSISERSAKLLQKIYVELLRVIRPLEKKGSYSSRVKNMDNSNDIEFMTSP